MTGFDVAVLLLVGLNAITGFVRGFVQEILALFAWVFAVIVIRYLHTPVTEFFEPHIGTGSGAAILAFALLLLVPYAVVKLIANWAGAKSRDSLLGPIDRVLGFGFGAVKGMIIVTLAFSVLVLGYDTVWGVGGRPAWITQARTYPFVNASSEALVTMIAERRERLGQGLNHRRLTMATDALYTPEVLGLAASLANHPWDDSLPLQGDARSKSCGSTIALGLSIDEGGRIERIGLRSQACAIGQAAAAIFAQAAVGLSPAQVRNAGDRIATWLSGEETLPDWPGLDAIAAARDYPARHGAIMLAWRAARDILPIE